MAKKDNRILWVIGVIALFFILGKGGFTFSGAVVGDVVQRDAPTSIGPDEQVTITVSTTKTGSYFGLVRENIPPGWTYVSGGQLDGNQVKFFLTNLVGGSISYTLQAPSSGTHQITGAYQFEEDLSPIQIGTSSIEIITCITHSTFSCSGNNVYWYDSCGAIEGVKETCNWQCSGSNCQRNTGADMNSDGEVVDGELLSYAQLWLDNQIGDTELLQAASAWLSGTSFPEPI